MPNSKERYPADLKAFALTLNFYSAKAYNYVRDTFDCHLPSPRTIRNWYNCVDGSPPKPTQGLSSLREAKHESSREDRRKSGSAHALPETYCKQRALRTCVFFR